MKAIGYQQPLPINDTASLINIELPKPVAKGRDILIKIDAIAVNPVDYKIRQSMASENREYKVLGWDSVGEVVGIGELTTQYKLGDKVYYAGDLNRQGSNAEYHLVDERIVGHKPNLLSNAEAAALPLTSITAYELLFEHLAIKKQQPELSKKSNEVILIVGAAGGVGSILVQLAKAITGATIIATASRESSKAWVEKLGAHFVIDHTKAMKPQVDTLIKDNNLGQITHIASLNSSDAYYDTYIELLAPFGKIAMIDDPKEPLDIMKLKLKSLSLHIEFMFARSMFNAPDIEEQSKLLNHVAELVDLGYVQSTIGKNLGRINAENLKLAHTELESGKSIGKIVLEGF
jgi:zinc-binding alcohol dehydrogenase family protein